MTILGDVSMARALFLVSFIVSSVKLHVDDMMVTDTMDLSHCKILDWEIIFFDVDLN